MNTRKITTLEDLKEVAQKKFLLLKHNTNPNPNKQRQTIQLPFKSYTELQHLIIDILKVSMMALDAVEEDSTTIKSPLNSIRDVLELIYHISPLEEMQLLDIIHEITTRPEEIKDSHKNTNTDEK